MTIEFLFKDGGVSFDEAETIPGVHRFQIIIATISKQSPYIIAIITQSSTFPPQFRTFEAASSQSFGGGNVLNKKTVYSRRGEPNVPGKRKGNPFKNYMQDFMRIALLVGKRMDMRIKRVPPKKKHEILFYNFPRHVIHDKHNLLRQKWF